jgi:two-component system OmpR family response regulator
VKILIVEDDEKIAAFIAKGLRERGYAVDVAHDGEAGEGLAHTESYEAAIIDIMLPGIDGLTLIEGMRAAGLRTPVLILSARRTIDDRVKGLRAGGDDYLVKPFSFFELEARIEALIRRSLPVETAGEGDVFRVADLELDPWKHEVRRHGQSIALQAREFRLLELLARNAGRVISKTSILEYVYEYNLRPANQCRRCSDSPTACQDRQGDRTQTHSHRARCRICPPHLTEIRPG